MESPPNFSSATLYAFEKKNSMLPYLFQTNISSFYVNIYYVGDFLKCTSALSIAKILANLSKTIQQKGDG
jgi:hypothetical protein